MIVLFPRAGRADDGDRLAGLDAEAHVAQDEFIVAIRERYVVELDAALELSDRAGRCSFRERVLGVEHFEESLRRRHRRLEDVVALRHVADRLEESAEEEPEEEELADRDLGGSRRELPRSLENDCDHGPGAQEFHRREVDRVAHHRAEKRAQVSAVDRFVVSLALSFAVERLEEAHPLDGLLRERVQVRQMTRAAHDRAFGPGP